MNHKMYLNDHEGWVFIYWDEFPKRDDKEEEKDGDKEKTWVCTGYGAEWI